MSELTPIELRLVERYVWVLDLVSRCAQGLDAGDWYYVANKAGEIAQAIRDGGRGLRAQVLRAAVAHHGRHYRAGRLLHPEAKGRR
jgi:hypothetical protein